MHALPVLFFAPLPCFALRPFVPLLFALPPVLLRPLRVLLSGGFLAFERVLKRNPVLPFSLRGKKLLFRLFCFFRHPVAFGGTWFSHAHHLPGQYCCGLQPIYIELKPFKNITVP